MQSELFAPMVALLGVLVSAAVSVIASRVIANNEARKINLEARKLYDVKLLDTRVQSYPALYKLLSHFIKRTRTETIRGQDLRWLFEGINEWDSANTLFLSSRSSNLIANVRATLERLLFETEATAYHAMHSMVMVPSHLISSESMDTKVFKQYELAALVTDAGALELSLRSDIGVFGVGDSDARIEPRGVDTYEKIRDA